MLKSIISSVHAFLVSEDGPTSVEYAVMLALIIVACVASIRTLGGSANTMFGKVNANV